MRKKLTKTHLLQSEVKGKKSDSNLKLLILQKLSKISQDKLKILDKITKLDLQAKLLLKMQVEAHIELLAEEKQQKEIPLPNK